MKDNFALGKVLLCLLASLLIYSCEAPENFSIELTGRIKTSDGKAVDQRGLLVLYIFDIEDQGQEIAIPIETNEYGVFFAKTKPGEVFIFPDRYSASITLGGTPHPLEIQDVERPNEVQTSAYVEFVPLYIDTIDMPARQDIEEPVLEGYDYP